MTKEGWGGGWSADSGGVGRVVRELAAVIGGCQGRVDGHGKGN